MGQPILPFHTFIFKIASRCNINCSYCFVYNKGDNRWMDQPKFMSNEIFKKSCEKILEHCIAHDKKIISLIFHGGEPLLVGLNRFIGYYNIIEDTLIANGIEVKIGMQSNGLLFTKELGDFFAQRKIRIGISIDGPPEINDRYRIDHQGNGTGKPLEAKLKLVSQNYSSIFSGFLVVIDVESDPIDIYKYLSRFRPKSIDFLLPYDNWDNRPVGKENANSDVYANWLIRLFNYWFELDEPIRIRMFHNMIRLMTGASSIVESLGLTPVDIIVIETNGDLEAVDSLKATFEGATYLGFNVTEHSLNEVAGHVNVKLRQKGSDSLNENCQKCEVLSVCGGGYIPNRYSNDNGFNNPSIYCSDLYETINHINMKVKSKLKLSINA